MLSVRDDVPRAGGARRWRAGLVAAVAPRDAPLPARQFSVGPMEQDEGGGLPPALSAFMGEYGRGHPPAEYLGKPGDVLLWHSQNMHGGSANISARPRLGLFARWSALHAMNCDVVIGVRKAILDAFAPKLGVPVGIFDCGADSLL
jgi:hypothetical protein